MYNTLDLTNCSCTPKPKKSWYLDTDNDKYVAETKEHYESPGAGWVEGTPKGMDCDDTKKCVTTDCTKVDWYLDNDTDGWYAEIKNDYKLCKPEGKWNTTSNDGEDCNDDDKYKFESLDVAGGVILDENYGGDEDLTSSQMDFNDFRGLILESETLNSIHKTASILMSYHDQSLQNCDRL